MCYRKPGGRCSPHATARVQACERKRDRAVGELKEDPLNPGLKSVVQRAVAALNEANRDFVKCPLGRLALADRIRFAGTIEEKEKIIDKHTFISENLVEVRERDSEKRRDIYSQKRAGLRSRGPRRRKTSVERAIGFDGDMPQDVMRGMGTKEERHAMANSSVSSNKTLEVLSMDSNREIALRARRRLSSRTVKFVPEKLKR